MSVPSIAPSWVAIRPGTNFIAATIVPAGALTTDAGVVRVTC